METATVKVSQVTERHKDVTIPQDNRVGEERTLEARGIARTGRRPREDAVKEEINGTSGDTAPSSAVNRQIDGWLEAWCPKAPFQCFSTINHITENALQLPLGLNQHISDPVFGGLSIVIIDV